MARFRWRADGGAAPASRWRGVLLRVSRSLRVGKPTAKRGLAAIGAIALVGITIHSTMAPQGGLSIGKSAAVGRTSVARTADSQALPVGQSEGGTGRTGQANASTSAFRQIILADIMIVAPKGLTSAQIAKLRKITGVRNMITFDGAQIRASGRKVSVIGVNPGTFRSWVPLATASNQSFWSALTRGDFVASVGARQRLGLRAGGIYPLIGATTQDVKFAMAARLHLSSVDLLVNQATSRKLGLVRQVAGLISAPGVSMTTLTRKVARILGRGGQVEVLRSQQLPVASYAPGTRPTTYIGLFKASAAEYCPGLSWTVLAAIGQIESADGTNLGPSTAGALGPMQFLPSTWAIWGTDGFGDTGSPNILNPYDAVPSAARLLCANGAAAGGSALSHAIFEYNHADWYVKEVLALAAAYAADYR